MQLWHRGEDLGSDEIPARRSRFYIFMGLIALLVAIIGFSSTYFVPLARGKFEAPAIVHVHGIAAFCWVLLYLLQSALIRAGAFPLHRAFGIAGIAIAATCLIGGIGTGMFVADREIAAGLADLGVASIVGTITGLTIFVCLVIAGVLNRGRPETHKRLMLLATLVLLWPAWFRFRHYFPDVPHPEYVFALIAADSLIVLAMLRDRLVEGRVHPVYLFVGIPVIVEQTFEAVFFGSPAWTQAGWTIYRTLGGTG